MSQATVELEVPSEPAVRDMPTQSIGSHMVCYYPKRKLRLQVITWNMGLKPAKDEEIEHMLPSKGRGLDIVTLGLQESNYGEGKSSYHSPSTDFEQPGPRSSKAVSINEDDKPFPQSLKPLGLHELDSKCLPQVDLAEPARYVMMEDSVEVLADADVSNEGFLSPARPCPTCMGGVRGYKASQLLVRFAYPTDANTAGLRALRSEKVRLQILKDPGCALLLFGGFLFFDRDSADQAQCVAASALCPGDDLRFQGPYSAMNQPSNPELLHRLAAENRLHAPSITDFVVAGVEQFCWIWPGEDLCNNIGPFPQGGFLFVFIRDGTHSLVYYKVSDKSMWCPRLSPDLENRDVLDLYAFSSNNEVEGEEDENRIFQFFRSVQTYLGDGWRLTDHISTSTKSALAGTGIRLAIFARHDLPITNVQKTWINTGTNLGFGRLANKGCVVTCFEVRGTSLCFINSHLSAKLDGISRRRQDCTLALQGARLGNHSLDLTMQFDHCFWFGDLNYRIDPTENRSAKSEKDKDIISKVMKDVNSPERLISGDQLSRIRKDMTDFAGFNEGKIEHAPSYKVLRKPGMIYDDQRAPAYTDRVLWKSLPHCRPNLTQTQLDVVKLVSSSDHKPVLAAFEVTPSDKIKIDDKNKSEALAIWFQKLLISGEQSLYNDQIDVEIHGLPQPLLSGTPNQMRLSRPRKGGKWKQSDCPVLRPNITAKDEKLQEVQEMVQHCALVLDFGIATIGGRRSMGAAIVPLLNAGCRDTSRLGGLKAWTVSFKEDLVLGNRRVGTCEGAVQVCYGRTANLEATAFNKVWKTKNRASAIGSWLADSISKHLLCSMCNVGSVRQASRQRSDKDDTSTETSTRPPARAETLAPRKYASALALEDEEVP